MPNISSSTASNNNFYGNNLSFSFSGAYLLVLFTPANNFAGEVIVYSRSGSTWAQSQVLQTSPQTPNTYFGQSFYGLSDGAGFYSVQSYVSSVSQQQYVLVYFTMLSGTTWTSQSFSVSVASYCTYSSSLTYDCSTLFVSAWNGTASGATVYVFSRSGTTWAQSQLALPTGITSGGSFYSISFTGDSSTLILGASGSVAVATRSGSTWTVQPLLTLANVSNSYVQTVGPGSSMALVAPTSSNNNKGLVYVLSPTAGVWSQPATIQPTDLMVGSYFGSNMQVSPDDKALGRHYF